MSRWFGKFSQRFYVNIDKNRQNKESGAQRGDILQRYFMHHIRKEILQ